MIRRIRPVKKPGFTIVPIYTFSSEFPILSMKLSKAAENKSDAP
jgi:hypothetical protein